MTLINMCLYSGRFTTPDLLWSAFPAQTPYHYAYNSPLTYRDPSGLAPEKEKEREELQGVYTMIMDILSVKKLRGGK